MVTTSSFVATFPTLACLVASSLRMSVVLMAVSWVVSGQTLALFCRLDRLDRLPVPQRDALATVFGLSAIPKGGEGRRVGRS
jgi:hypothetical protein